MIVPGVGRQTLLGFMESLGKSDCHMALLRDGASIGPDTTAFDGSGEVRASGYAAGGKRLQGFSCGLDNGVAWAAWNTVEWMNATIKASGAVIYAKENGNRIVAVLDFGEEKASSQSLFRVKMPPPGADNAVFWLS